MRTGPDRAKLDQALAHAAAGRLPQARAALLRLAQQHPRDPDILGPLIATLARLGELDAALYYADRAVAAAAEGDGKAGAGGAGGMGGALADRARVRMLLGRASDAVDDLSAALALAPEDDRLRAVLGQALHRQERFDEALTVLEGGRSGGGAGLDHPGASPLLAQTYAALLMAIGRADEALVLQRAVIPLDPANPAAAERAANAALYALDSSPAEIKELAERYGRLVSVRTPAARPPHPNDPDPERRLRVGFIGGDFRSHASMRFFEPLAASCPRDRLELHCYMTTPLVDSVTERIGALVASLRAVHALTTPELVALLRADRLDVLIDLAGRTAGHRIEAFHHRPAPVQMTWYGQPATTGLPAIDYRIVDSLTDPAPGARRITTPSGSCASTRSASSSSRPPARRTYSPRPRSGGGVMARPPAARSPSAASAASPR